jgi:mRNA interferase MazF
MPTPRRGEVWLVRFPFTDLTSAKVRPALVLASHGEDTIVLGIFSRSPGPLVRDTWVRIDAGHPAFRRTGLKQTSVLKAEKIAVIHESVLRSRLGTLPPDLLVDIEVALKKALQLS